MRRLIQLAILLAAAASLYEASNLIPAYRDPCRLFNADAFYPTGPECR